LFYDVLFLFGESMAKLHFYYSAMNAGKSTLLLQSSHNYNERGMKTLILTPAVDDRFGAGKVTTRIGLQSDAVTYMPDDNLYNTVVRLNDKNQPVRCVLIDEAQFLTKQQVTELCRIVDEFNIPVLAYGLRTDFQGETFEGSRDLLAWADALIEMKTICHCGRKAMMNLRIDQAGRAIKRGEQIQIGGNESYIATCRKHFNLEHGEVVRVPTAMHKPGVNHEAREV
jgi:thymidine kinase